MQKPLSNKYEESIGGPENHLRANVIALVNTIIIPVDNLVKTAPSLYA